MVQLNLKETDYKNLNKVTKFGWVSNTAKPLETGSYFLNYNNVKYYMSYKDELELFKQVVLRE